MTINMAEYMAERRKNRRSVLLSMHGNACKECGATEKLEFNHRDLKAREFRLSGAGLDKSWQRILDEVAKCDLLCSECHKAYTAGQWASGELITHNKNTSPLEHGTPRMYTETNCRCILCRQAKSAYRKKEIGYLDKVVVE